MTEYGPYDALWKLQYYAIPGPSFMGYWRDYSLYDKWKSWDAANAEATWVIRHTASSTKYNLYRLLSKNGARMPYMRYSRD